MSAPPPKSARTEGGKGGAKGGKGGAKGPQGRPQRIVVNHYAVLEVEEDADEDEIKKAYRKLVLKWHPDRHPDLKEQAEDQIRKVNAAYEVLGNPAKRMTYDQQFRAVNAEKRGVKVTTKQKETPRMLIPKEFMVQPIGYPDKFLRCGEQRLQAQSRSEAQADFQTFFQAAKLALWWLPEVNNMCRLRALGSKATGEKKGAEGGYAGGMNIALVEKKGVGGKKTGEIPVGDVIDVNLSAAKKGERKDAVNFIVMKSPIYEGAFRFHSATDKSRYLAFIPPLDFKAVRLSGEEQDGIIDFILVDFSSMFKFIDLEEVLLPAVGKGVWVPLDKIQEDKNIIDYFKTVMQKEVWQAEDFATYFAGHWQLWEYRDSDKSVRRRPPSDQLVKVLQESKSGDSVASAIMSAEDVELLPLAIAARAARVLAGSVPEGLGLRIAAQRRLLGAMMGILTAALKNGTAQDLPFEELLAASEGIRELGGDVVGEELAQRAAAAKILADLLFDRVVQASRNDKPLELGGKIIGRLLRLPGAVTRQAPLKLAFQPALAGTTAEPLAEVLLGAVEGRCGDLAAVAVDELLAQLGRKDLSPSDRDTIHEVLADVGPRHLSVVIQLRAQTNNLSASVLKDVMLALAAAGMDSKDLRAVVEELAAKVKGLDRGSLLSLAMSAAKNEVLRPAMSAVLRSAAVSLGDWELIDLIRLLLATAKAKAQVEPDAKEALLMSALGCVQPHFAGMPAGDLLKLVLAVSSFGSSGLLDAAADAVGARLSHFPQAQLVLLTQGLAQSLPSGHGVLTKLVEFWPGALEVSNNSSRLSADQVAKLAQALNPVLAHADRSHHVRFAAVAGQFLLDRVKDVTEAVRHLVVLELESGGSLAPFTQGGELTRALRKARTGRSRSRSPRQGKGTGEARDRAMAKGRGKAFKTATQTKM